MTEEDEAFDEIARKQGMWGGGFPAKQRMAADKLHWSDCAVHNAPAYPAGECDCGVEKEQEEDWGALAEKQLASIKRDTQANFEDAMVRATHKVMAEFEAQPAQEPVTLPCCECTDVSAIKWNPFNGVVQCHNCGQVYTASLAAQTRREWVGLTDEDRKAALLAAYKEWECEELLLCAREDYLLIEQALKEKNNGT